jgi:lysophospholipase L1-like esterase
MGDSPLGPASSGTEGSAPWLFQARKALSGLAPRARGGAGEPLRRAILVFASLLIFLAAAETTLGVIPAGRLINVYNRRMTAGLDCYPTNPRGYFPLDLSDPATRERFEALRVRRVAQCASYAPYAVELTYNSLQFRDQEPGPRRPGVRRVAVLGDSFTEGQGVKERDAYPRVLETVLNGSEGPKWEVLNFARRGADFPALYDNFMQLLAYDPDIVIYGMVLNDCEQSRAFRARHAFVTAYVDAHEQQRAPWTSRPAFGMRTVLFVQHRLEQFRLDGAMRDWYSELYAEPNQDGWERSKAHIEEMNNRMRLRGGHFLVAMWPMLPYLDAGYPFQGVHETVGKFFLASGIPWLDLLPTLSGRPANYLWAHPLDAHPNALAHRLVARDLARAVRRLAEGAPRVAR